MKVEIDQRRRDILHRREPLVIVARREQPVEQVGRHRLAGAGMAGVRAEHLGRLQPMLVELAGQFHEVARNDVPETKA